MAQDIYLHFYVIYDTLEFENKFKKHQLELRLFLSFVLLVFLFNVLFYLLVFV